MAGRANIERPRLAWADSARGICIILVVMMHSTLGVQEAFGAAGWLDPVVAFARPFRVPAFFLVSGFFFAAALRRPISEIVDGRLKRLAYVFIVWSLLLLVLKGGFLAIDSPRAALAWLALLPLEPHGALWFIHALILFSAAIIVLREAPGWFVLMLGAGLHLLTPDTGWTAVDEFADRFVFFAAGCRCAGVIGEAAGMARRERWLAVAVVSLSALAISLFVWPQAFHMAPALPLAAGVLGLALGFLGALGLVLTCALIAESRPGRALGWLGRRTLPIYLAFTVPMAAARLALVDTGLVTDIGAVSLLVTLAAIAAALAMETLAQRMGLGFLYAMPPILAPRAATTSPTAMGSALR